MIDQRMPYVVCFSELHHHVV